MKNYVKFPLLLSPLIFNPLTICMSSCSFANNLSITGGSINLQASRSGVDQNLWKCMSNNVNISRNIFWSIEPQIQGIYSKYNLENEGINIVWKDLPPGTYNFKLKGESNSQGNQNVVYSPNIKLQIQGTLNLSGGIEQIEGYVSGQFAKNPWKAIYLGQNYSKTAHWSIESKDEFVNKINIEFDDNLDGAIIKWNDLVPGKYLFTVKCLFDSSTGEKIIATSNIITLYVSQEDDLILSGGVQFTTAPSYKYGRIEKPLVAFLPSTGEDVTLQCFFEIIEPSVEDIVYIGKDDSNIRIYWNEVRSDHLLMNFKIQVTYKKKTVLYPNIFWIKFSS